MFICLFNKLVSTCSLLSFLANSRKLSLGNKAFLVEKYLDESLPGVKVPSVWLSQWHPLGHLQVAPNSRGHCLCVGFGSAVSATLHLFGWVHIWKSPIEVSPGRLERKGMLQHLELVSRQPWVSIKSGSRKACARQVVVSRGVPSLWDIQPLCWPVALGWLPSFKLLHDWVILLWKGPVWWAVWGACWCDPISCWRLVLSILMACPLPAAESVLERCGVFFSVLFCFGGVGVTVCFGRQPVISHLGASCFQKFMLSLPWGSAYIFLSQSHTATPSLFSLDISF